MPPLSRLQNNNRVLRWIASRLAVQPKELFECIPVIDIYLAFQLSTEFQSINEININPVTAYLNNTTSNRLLTARCLHFNVARGK
jgi:hypothetical protein